MALAAALRLGWMPFLVPFGLALGLRLSLVAWGLPFWYDEVWTANFAVFSIPMEEVLRRLRGEDAHPPLAYLLFRAWAWAFGLRDPLVAYSPEVEAGLRALSALLGAGTAGLTGLLAQALGAGPFRSLGAGVLYALAPVALVREAEVHVYPAAAFFTALALLLWAKGRPLPFALAALLAFHAHYLSLLLLLLPALSLRPWGLLPYGVAVPWLLYALPGQMAGLGAKSPFNGPLWEAWPRIAAFAHTPDPILVGVGGLLWAMAFFGRRTGPVLLLYLLLWLGLLPVLTGFGAWSVRYTTLVLPLVLAGASTASPRLWGALLLLPLLAWGPALPLVQGEYLAFRTPSLMALALVSEPGPVVASNRPLAVVAKYVCRSCSVSILDSKGLEGLRGGGYLFLDRVSLGLLFPQGLPLPAGLEPAWAQEGEGVYLIRLRPPP